MARLFTLPETEELVLLYADDVMRVCTYYLGSRNQAEDAFQDVFIKVIRKRDTYKGDCPPKFWLLAVARNVCKDYLKSSWATRTSSYNQLTEDAGEKAYDEVEGRISEMNSEEDNYFDHLEPSGKLWDAIMQLPATMKDVILFKYYNDMENSDIAKACGITESSVRSRLHRARKLLDPVLSEIKDTNIKSSDKGEKEVRHEKLVR